MIGENGKDYYLTVVADGKTLTASNPGSLPRAAGQRLV
jgi:hypothetical protein